jgi:hypothetical protein
VARRVLQLSVRRSGSTVKGLSGSPELPSQPRRSRFDAPHDGPNVPPGDIKKYSTRDVGPPKVVPAHLAGE